MHWGSKACSIGCTRPCLGSQSVRSRAQLSRPRSACQMADLGQNIGSESSAPAVNECLKCRSATGEPIFISSSQLQFRSKQRRACHQQPWYEWKLHAIVLQTSFVRSRDWIDGDQATRLCCPMSMGDMTQWLWFRTFMSVTGASESGWSTGWRLRRARGSKYTGMKPCSLSVIVSLLLSTPSLSSMDYNPHAQGHAVSWQAQK